MIGRLAVVLNGQTRRLTWNQIDADLKDSVELLHLLGQRVCAAAAAES